MLMMMPPLLRYFWFHSIYSLAASCSLQSAVCSLQCAVCKCHTPVFLGHGCIRRQKIQGKIYPWCKDTFWKNGNLPVHTFYLLPPSKTTFEENISMFRKRLIDRGYPQTMLENLLSDISSQRGSLHSWNTTTKRKKKYCLSWHSTSPQCLL